jgi:hypothetical protein
MPRTRCSRGWQPGMPPPLSDGGRRPRARARGRALPRSRRARR